MAGYARKERSFAAHAACGNAERRRTEGCITQVRSAEGRECERRAQAIPRIACTTYVNVDPIRPKFAQVCLRRDVPHFGQRAISSECWS